MDKNIYEHTRKWWGPNIVIIDENFSPTLCVEGEEELEEDADIILEVLDMNFLSGRKKDLNKGIKYYSGFWNREHGLIVYKVIDNVYMKLDVSEYDLGRSPRKNQMVSIVREKLKVVRKVRSRSVKP